MNRNTVYYFRSLFLTPDNSICLDGSSYCELTVQLIYYYARVSQETIRNTNWSCCHQTVMLLFGFCLLDTLHERCALHITIFP